MRIGNQDFEIRLQRARRRGGRAVAFSIGLAFALGTTAMTLAADRKFVRDLTIEQRPMAQLSPTTGVTNGLKVRIRLDRKAGKYRVGEYVTLFVRTNSDAYLTIFNTGSSGKVHILFPNAHQTSNFVKGSTDLRIPPADAGFGIKVSDPPGVDLVTVVATRKPAPLLRSALMFANGPFKTLKDPANSVAERIRIALRKDHGASSAGTKHGWSQANLKVYTVRN